MILYVHNEYGARVWTAIAYDPVQNAVSVRFFHARPPASAGSADDLMPNQHLGITRDEWNEETKIEPDGSKLDPKGKTEVESGPYGWIVRLKLSNGATS